MAPQRWTKRIAKEAETMCPRDAWCDPGHRIDISAQENGKELFGHIYHFMIPIGIYTLKKIYRSIFDTSESRCRMTSRISSLFPRSLLIIMAPSRDAIIIVA